MPNPRRPRPYYWILDSHTPVPVWSGEQWARWYEQSAEARIVAQDEVGGTLVSTVFLALDHGFGFDGPPILFETMVLLRHGLSPGPHDWEHVQCQRYSTWAEAELGHARILAGIRSVVAMVEAVGETP